MSIYEQIRDQESGPAGQAWREADRQESELRNLYESLREDNRYTEEHKSRQAWDAWISKKDAILEGRKQAKETLQKQARSAERYSVPLPKDASSVVKDATELTAIQHEASRIKEKVQRLQETNPLSGGDKAEPLRAEYGRGMELGGVEGAAICRGTLSAAEDLGVPVDSVVDSFRKDHHRESQERAQAANQSAFTIGTRIKEPPFPRPDDVPPVPPQSLDSVLTNRARGYKPQPTRERVKLPWLR